MGGATSHSGDSDLGRHRGVCEADARAIAEEREAGVLGAAYESICVRCACVFRDLWSAEVFARRAIGLENPMRLNPAVSLAAQDRKTGGSGPQKNAVASFVQA